ncbi:hypothetical protein PLICRDRAFT_172831 [Plicaturopsis crispa FD-325 SS-3]|nr:hypothetical protein PLICRDRAFT_172831 [Plicaturopsis crispa FD-325 SS-3]
MARPYGLPTPSTRRNVSMTPHGVTTDYNQSVANELRNLHIEDTVRYRTPDGARVPHPVKSVPPTPMSLDDNLRHGGRASELRLQPRLSLSRGEGAGRKALSNGRAQYGNRRAREGELSVIEEADDHSIVGNAQMRDVYAPHMPAFAGNEYVSRRKVRASDDTPSTGVNRLRAPGRAPSENPIPFSRSKPASHAREAREGGTLVPQGHGEDEPHMPAIAGNENVSQDEVRGRRDALTTGVNRLRAPESAPINPSPSSKPPTAAREGEGPKGTSNDVGELTAIGAGATARVSEPVNDGVERVRGRERVISAAVDAHGRVSTIPRRTDARRGGHETFATANPFNGTGTRVGRNRTNNNDSRHHRRDARAAQYTPPNEINESLAHDERTTVRSEKREFANRTHLDTRARARVHLYDRERSLPLRESASAEADRQDRRGRAVARPTSDHLDWMPMGRRDTARQFASRTEVDGALARRDRAIARPGNEEAATTYHGVRAIARAERPIPPSFSVYADVALLADDGGGGFDVVERRGRDFDRSARTGRRDRSNDRAGQLEHRGSNEQPRATRYASPNEVNHALARGERAVARSDERDVKLTTHRVSRAVARTEQPRPPPSTTRANAAALAHGGNGGVDAVERRERDFVGNARAGRRDRSNDRQDRPQRGRLFRRPMATEYAPPDGEDVGSARMGRAYARPTDRVLERKTHQHSEAYPRLSARSSPSSRAPTGSAWLMRDAGRRGGPDWRVCEASAQIAYHRLDGDGLSPRLRRATAHQVVEDRERKRAIAISGGPKISANAQRHVGHRARRSRDFGSETGSHFDAARRNFVAASVSSWSSASSGTIVPASRSSSSAQRASAHNIADNNHDSRASVYSTDVDVRHAMDSFGYVQDRRDDSDSDDADDSETENVEASSESHDCDCGGKCRCGEHPLPYGESRFDEPESEYCAPAHIQIPLSSEWCASIDVDHDGSDSYPNMVCFPVVYDQESEYDDEYFDECFEYNDETGSYDPEYDCEPCYQFDDGYYECGSDEELCYDGDPQDEGNCYYDGQTGIIECCDGRLPRHWVGTYTS